MPGRRVRTALQRAWMKIEFTDTCWLWVGSLTSAGYGKIYDDTRRLSQAHRVMYEALVGPVPAGKELDHTCRVRRCVRPDHLEPVTHRENLLRGDTLAARHAKVTHCPRNHEYTPENIIWKGTRRNCRACHNAAQVARRERKAKWDRAFEEGVTFEGDEREVVISTPRKRK